MEHSRNGTAVGDTRGTSGASAGTGASSVGVDCTGVLDALDVAVMALRPENGELVFMNAAAKRAFPQSAAGAAPSGAIAQLCTACVNAVPAHGGGVNFELRLGSGRTARTWSVSARQVQWADGRPARLLTLLDGSSPEALRGRLEAELYTDSLTALPNKRRLNEDFASMASRGGGFGVVALFDLDGFKHVNDTYGHSTGDVLLHRLAAHLRENPLLGGHLYRVGGDEFVLCRKAGREAFDEDVFRREIEDGLAQLLHTYTLPIIDTACTLSVGLSFFPAQGDALPELLRKAEIALYRAKSAGGGRMMVFEEAFDTAKKFSDFYISLKPLLTAGGATYGYELVDSSLEDDENMVSLNRQEYNRAIDLLCPADLEGDTVYFIHHTNQLGHAAVQNNLPKERFVIQVPASDAKREWKAYKALKQGGYRLAVNQLGRDNASYALLKLADFVCFSPSLSAGTCKKLMDAYPGIRFIATGVDTQRDFETAQKLGYSLFQGRYFQQPAQLRKVKEVDPLQANYYRLMSLTAAAGYVDFKQIADIISSDVGLSYRLLKQLNAVGTGLRGRVTSVEMAIPYLGEENLKRWIALVALRGLAGDKPLELVRMSLVRARFGELLEEKLAPGSDTKQVFFCGLLSLLHVALGVSREELFDQLVVVDDEIKQSLLGAGGPYSELVAFFSHYEYADWEDVAAFARKRQLPCEDIFEAHMAAAQWYNRLVTV